MLILSSGTVNRYMQADRLRDGQMCRQTEGLANGWMEKQRQNDREVDKWKGSGKEGKRDRLTDHSWTDKQADRQMDRQAADT